MNSERLQEWIKGAAKRLLPIWIFFAVAGANAVTVTGTYNGILVYSASNNKVSITGCTSSLSGSISIPGTINISGSNLPVTSIGMFAFHSCSALTSVTIPSSVTTIGSFAFAECSGLASVTIPNSVTTIGVGSFAACTNLISISVDSANPNYFSENNVIFDKLQTTLIQFPAGISGTYAIPSGVTSIGMYAFESCSGLTSVTIPNGVTTIQQQAFSGCANLATITIPASVTNIQILAFSGCFGMTSITVDPANPLYSSSNGVLFDKAQTTLIEYPAGVSGTYTIANTVTSIGSWAFAWCNITSVTIPASVTNSGTGAFYYSSGLINATFQGNAPTSSFYSDPFDGAASGFHITYFNGAKGFSSSPWNLYPSQGINATTPVVTNNPSDVAVSSSNTVTFVASATANQPPSVQWQYSPTGISGTFTNIDVFSNPSALTGTLSLTNVTLAQDGAYRAVFTNYGGSGTSNAAALYVYPFNYTVSGGTVTISRLYYSGSIGAVNIPSTINELPVTCIAPTAFSSYPSITSVTIPNSVTNIGNAAFGGCKFTSITIPSGVTSISASVFSTCYNLVNVNLPNGLTSIGNSAFYRCQSLPTPVLPINVTNIGNSAFYGCTSFSNITIPKNVTNLGTSAFASCSGLKYAIFMGDAPTTGSNIFLNAAVGFTVYYCDGAAGFNSPNWTDSGGDTYPAVNMGAYSPVKPWLLSKGYAHDSDLRKTPNGDGVPLLMSYALNLDPTQNQSRNLPKPYVSGSNMCLTYYASNPDVTYTVQSSADLQNWTTDGVSVSGPDANGCYTASIPMSDPRRFLRLVVSH